MKTARVIYTLLGISLLLGIVIVSGLSPAGVQALVNTPTPTIDPNVIINQIEAQTADGLYDLGLSYYQGTGGQPDYAQALAFFTQAADQGSVEAMFALGVMYENGQGVQADINQAVFWYDQAAQNGMAQAQYWLGQLYFWGTKVPKNYDQAELWLIPAAQQNYVDAQYYLGLMYVMRSQDPLSTKSTDPFDAYKWLRLAQINGQEQAAQVLATPEQRLTSDQKVQAEAFITDVLQSVDNDGLTPLFKAVLAGKTAVVENLLTYEIDINAGDPQTGFVPLHFAAGNGFPEITMMLIDAGADVTVKSLTAITPLHLAASGPIAELLIASGSEINALDNEGHTPLDWAVEKNRTDVIDVLTSHGALTGAEASAASPTTTQAGVSEQGAFSPLEGSVAEQIGQFEKLTWFGPYESPSIKWSPDDASLAVLDWMSGIRLFDASNLDAESLFVEDDLPAGNISDIFFSPDGELLSLTGDSRIGAVGTYPFMMWNMTTGTPIAELSVSISFQHYSAQSADGTVLAIGQDDGTIQLWNLDEPVPTGEPFRTLSSNTAVCRHLTLNSNGSRLAAGGGDQYVWVWDTTTGEQITQLKGSLSGILDTAFSPDGTLLAVGDYDGVTLWNAETFSRISTLSIGSVSQLVNALAFSHDGSVLAVAAGDAITLWDTQKGEKLAEWNAAPVPEILDLAFSPDGTRLASVNVDNTVTVWGLKAASSVEEESVMLYYPITASNATHLVSIERLQLADVRSIAWHPLYPSAFIVVTYSQLAVYAPPDLPQIILPQNLFNVPQVVFSTDGSQLIFAGAPITIVDSVTGQTVRTLGSGTEYAEKIALSANGTRLASIQTLGGSTSVRIWDMTTGQKLQEWKPGSQAGIESLAFSPDGVWLAVGVSDAVNILDVITGETVSTLSNPDGTMGYWGVNKAVFSPDGARLAVGTVGNPHLAVWDTSTWELVTLLGVDSYQPVSDIAFGPDGTILASAGYDGVMHLWDAQTGQSLMTQNVGFGYEGASTVAFNKDGTVLATAGEALALWSVTEDVPPQSTAPPDTDSAVAEPSGEQSLTPLLGSQPFTLQNSNQIGQLAVIEGGERWGASLAFSPDNHYLAAGNDSLIQLWTTANGSPLEVFEGEDSQVTRLSFSPDGQTLACGRSSGLVEVWDMGTGLKRLDLAGHTDRVAAVIFNQDGTTVASASYDGFIRIWDTTSGNVQIVLEGHAEGVRAIAYSPDGRILASGGFDGTIRLWDVQTGEIQSILPAYEGWVSSLAFSPDGTILAAADMTIELWDVASGASQMLLSGHTNSVIDLVFTPDGKGLISASLDTTARIWDVTTGETVVTFSPKAMIGDMAVSADGTTIALATDDRRISIWGVSGTQALATESTGVGNVVLEFQIGGPVGTLAFSPDGSIFAMGSSQTPTVHLIDLNSGTILNSVEGVYSPSFAFSPDGALLATGDFDGIRLWDVFTGTQTAEYPRTYESGESPVFVAGLAFTQDGKTLALLDGSGGFQLRNLVTGDLVYSQISSVGFAREVALAADGAHFIVAGFDAIEMRDVATGEVTATYQGPFESVTVSPGGAAVAYSDFSYIHVLDAFSWNELASFQLEMSGLGVLALDRDVSVLAGGFENGNVQLWDVMSGETIMTFEKPLGTISALQFSPDGRLLASGGQDETVRLWAMDAAMSPITLSASEASDAQESNDQESSETEAVYLPSGLIELNDRVEDPVNDVNESYIDVIGFTASLEGETLTAIFELRELPPELTFNRDDMPKDKSYLEYWWGVEVYLSPDHEDYDYKINAYYVVSNEPAFAGPIEDIVQVRVLQYEGEGSSTYMDVPASIEVDYENNTITLRGAIPGITEDAVFSFQTHDHLAINTADAP
jgi:WD40 repeat protein